MNMGVSSSASVLSNLVGMYYVVWSGWFVFFECA